MRFAPRLRGKEQAMNIQNAYKRKMAAQLKEWSAQVKLMEDRVGRRPRQIHQDIYVRQRTEFRVQINRLVP